MSQMNRIVINCPCGNRVSISQYATDQYYQKIIDSSRCGRCLDISEPDNVILSLPGNIYMRPTLALRHTKN